MAVDNNPATPPPTSGNVYGRIIRERGTTKIVLAFLALGVVFLLYRQFHTYRVNATQWTALQPIPNGLTVIGLHDQDRPGKKRRFVAIESNTAWQIRRPDDLEEEEPSEADPPEVSEEQRDRGQAPAGQGRAVKGQIVPLEIVMKESPVVLTEAHFTGAWVETRDDPFRGEYYAVHISLNDEGHSRFWQYSSQHQGERLVFALKGDIITCTKMDNPPPLYLWTFTRSLSIEPIWVKEDANRFADYLNGKR
jgi:hypothetical protein